MTVVLDRAKRGLKRTSRCLVGQILGCPLEAELPLMLNTIPQVQIDEILIRNPGLFGHRLEVASNIGAQSDGHLLLQT